MQHIANIAGNKTLVMPVPAFNVINGGSHAGNKLAMQVYIFYLHGIYHCNLKLQNYFVARFY
jgi:enolase